MISNLLKASGFKVLIAPKEIQEAVRNIAKVNNLSRVQRWIKDNKITRLGFSYRLDPVDGVDFFMRLIHQLASLKLLPEDNGPLRGIFFAGLPDACDIIQKKLHGSVVCFPGDETPFQSLSKLLVDPKFFPKDIKESHEYDDMRWQFASTYVESEKYLKVTPPNHSGYPSFGKDDDSVAKRLEFAKSNHSLPLTRVHAGPYSSDRLEAINLFISWTKDLAKGGFLDILSIGSSQLSQSKFGENWDGLSNGGGVPVNSEIEYHLIKEAAKPMLVRTYAGTKNIKDLAAMYERALNISWHALSFWWFCEIDGRGDNSLLENLTEHFDTIRFIASTGKPLEPNVPHHFAFRGADDATFVISGFLCAKAAKILGIKDLILQMMLNTPKYTWGIQDLAKARVLLKLTKSLEDENFHVHLQTRAGLDYFSPDIEKAKIQLAAVTALMDDIEPENPDSPEIIHVVSYSEAVRLADPDIMEESLKITLGALKEYRNLKKQNKLSIHDFDKDINLHYEDLLQECKEAIDFLEQKFPDLYTPQGFYRLFEQGYFPLPFLLDEKNKFPFVTQQSTTLRNGGIKVIKNGKIIPTKERYEQIFNATYFQ
ncbi:MAG: hypothetical protein J1D77_03365 [Muribaculaceae bacterium]|nr:hypothetical protein [Muribaculaceae bacterium]